MNPEEAPEAPAEATPTPEAGNRSASPAGPGDVPADDAPAVPIEAAPGGEGQEQPAPAPAHTTVADEGPVGADVPWVPIGVAGVLGAVLVGWLATRGRASAPPQLETRPDVLDAALPVQETPEPLGLAARLRDRMARSREALAARFDTLFGRDTVDEDLLDELEEVLLVADVGMPTTTKIVDGLRARMKEGEDDPAMLHQALRDDVRAMLQAVHTPFAVPDGVSPFVLLVVGVNGSGKTTSIGKIAARLTAEGHKVMLAAGDTYRAAAAEQLEIWAERAKADIVRHDEGADPAAVAYDALDAALARGCDVVIVDTAGRLQTRAPLMEELSKVRRVIDKKVPGAPHATLLVLDGTMGQNAMSQARSFHEATPLSGVVVTKLDGTAKGGMVLAVASEMALPVAFIGIGEQVDDLRPFEVDAFVDAMV